MVTYIIAKQEYSEKALRMWGSPWVWRTKVKIRQAPPRDEESFHTWLWSQVKNYGLGVYGLTRTQARGESRGFHPVMIAYVDEDYIRIEKGYTDVKSHPRLPMSRQLYFKQPQRRLKFRKRGSRF